MIETVRNFTTKSTTPYSSINFEPLLFAFNIKDDPLLFRFLMYEGIWSSWEPIGKGNELSDTWDNNLIYEFKGPSSIEIYADHQFSAFNQLDVLSIHMYPPKSEDNICSASFSLKSYQSFQTVLIEVCISDVKVYNNLTVMDGVNPLLSTEYKMALRREKTRNSYFRLNNNLKVSCYLSMAEEG